MSSLLGVTSTSLGHGPTYTAVIVIGLVLWVIALISLVSSWRRRR